MSASNKVWKMKDSEYNLKNFTLIMRGIRTSIRELQYPFFDPMMSSKMKKNQEGKQNIEITL